MVPSHSSCLAGAEELGPLKHSKTVSGRCSKFFGESRFINTIIIKLLLKPSPRFSRCFSGGSRWAVVADFIALCGIWASSFLLRAWKIRLILFRFFPSSRSSALPAPRIRLVPREERSWAEYIRRTNQSSNFSKLTGFSPA